MPADAPTLRENVRSLPPAAWVLFGGSFVNRFGTFVTVFLVLYVTRLGYSASEAGLALSAYGVSRPASAALLTDLLPPAQRVTAFALYRLAINVGFAAGPAVAGFLAERSFFLVFLGDALTSLVFGVAAL